jgi:hypothetical protein
MRTRTTKKLAQRIDLNYFKRPTLYKRARFWLSVLLPVVALVWIASRSTAKDSRVYSSGRMSAAHAVLEKECATCHLQQSGTFSAKAADAACLKCHDGPAHHPIAQNANAVANSQECATCHSEHRGRINIAAVSNQACAQCHANLAAVRPATARFSDHIRSFESDHPEPDAIEKSNRDPSTIKLNHAIHMKPIRRGPSGPSVQLQCGDCHRPSASSAPWPYADAKDTAATHSYSDRDELRAVGTNGLAPRNPFTGRELMAPVKFATACASCHLLTFDKRFDEGAPHDKPEVVHAFVAKKLQDYIAAHPNELRVSRDPSRDLTGKPLAAESRTLTPAQWVTERTADAEQLLWRKTCRQCHSVLQGTVATLLPQAQETRELAVPQIAPAETTTRWMPHAKFDHDAHRSFTCLSCHQKALSSTESWDILVPHVTTCRTCHAPGPDHAESRCFECHTYHDWSQRKEVTPQFTLPSLRNGGR